MTDPARAQAERFLDHLAVERGLSPNTLAAYRNDLSRYVSFLAERGVDDVAQASEDDVSGFVASLSATAYEPGKRYRASSVARALAAVRSFHRFLLMEGDTDEDASAGVVVNGCVGALRSPGTLDAGTERSTTSFTGAPVSRSSTNNVPILVGCTTAAMATPSRSNSTNTGCDARS